MNSSRYISAIIHYKRGSHLSVDGEVFITVLAPAVGIVAGVIIEFSLKSFEGYILQRKEQYKLNSPKIIPITNISNGNNSNIFRKALHRITPTLAIRSVVFIYKQLISSQSLRIAVSSSFKVINLIIVVRFGILTRNFFIYCYQKRNQENMFRVAVNTLCWIVASRERDKMVNLAFVLVSLITARIWVTKNRTARRVLKIWVLISFLNLSNYIYIEPKVLSHRPSDIGTFGLPRVEYLMKPLSSFTENTTNSKISMIGKEETIVISSPLQNDMPKGIVQDFGSKMNEIIKNSTLEEEKIVLAKKEGLQRGKTSRSHLTTKSNRRMNSLRNLNKTTFDDKLIPLPIENNLEKLSNSTKIKEKKVQ